MKRPKILNQVDVVISVVRDELRSYGSLDSCIHTSRLLLRVLQLLKVPDAYLLTVQAMVFNKAASSYFEEHGTPNDESSKRAYDRAGAALVKVGDRDCIPPEGQWAGHLAVIVPNAAATADHWLIDAALPQANTASFRIAVPPVCLEVTDAFVIGKEEMKFTIEGMRICYSAYPDDQSYNDSEDCMKKRGLTKAAKTVVARIKERME